MTIQTGILIYALVGIAVLFLNCFIAGYSGEEPSIKDFREGLFWPITLMAFLGSLFKILISLSKSKTKKSKNSK